MSVCVCVGGGGGGEFNKSADTKVIIAAFLKCTKLMLEVIS